MKRFVCFSLVTVALYANPTGHEVMHGSASIQQIDRNTLHIHAGDKAIIHWRDFSIEKGELTKVFQESSKSALLNRVKGENPSHIFGRLESNGQIFLINPHGIVIGKEGAIDTGAFLASTFDILDQDFLSGKEILFAGDSQAAVTILGTITSTDGDITLIGYHVFNEGTLSAPCGSVHTGAGTSILLKPEGKERLFIKPAQGNKEGLGIDHQGTIEAIQVELKAADNLYELAIRSDGVINATGTIEKEGRILLVGGENVAVSGTLSAKNSNETGGTVHVIGDHVSLVADGKITVDGKYGGGTVLFGGDYQGKNPEIPNAITNVTHPQTLVSANALETGEGGKIIFWSDLSTCNLGRVTAEGGPEGGDGGFIEISGATLRSTGEVSTHAPKGKTGTLLWDPIDMNIVPGALVPTNATPLPTTTATVQPGSVGATDVSTALGGSNVIVSSSGAAGAGTGTLTLQTGATISWASGNQLTLIAPAGASDVNINGTINSTGAGPLLIQSDSGNVNVRGGGGAGASIFFNDGNVTLIGNNVTVRGPGGAANEAGEILNNFNTSAGALSMTANTGNVTIQGGDANSCYASVGTGTGALTIAAPFGNVVVQGGSQQFTNADVISNSGVVNISAAGTMTVQGGSGDRSPAEVSSRFAPGAINIAIGSNLTVAGGSQNRCFGQIGGTGLGGTTYTADVTANVGGSVRVVGGSFANAYAQIGFGSPLNANVTDIFEGNVTVNLTGNGNVSVIGGSGSDCYAHIGHHGGIAGLNNKIVFIGQFVPPVPFGVPTTPAITTVSAPNGPVTVTGGSGAGGGYAMIGYGGRSYGGSNPGNFGDSWYGDVFVTCENFQVTGGSANDCFAVIGYGTGFESSFGAMIGEFNTIQVSATNSLTPTNTITGGSGPTNSCIGAIGVGMQHPNNGFELFNLAQNNENINVIAGGNLTITGGSNTTNVAGVGMGFRLGATSDLVGSSNVTITLGGDLTATATTNGSHAEIATGRAATTPFPFGPFDYNVAMTITANNATFIGGTDANSLAIVDHVGTGNCLFNIAGNLQMQARTGGCDFDSNGSTDFQVGGNFTSNSIGTAANNFQVGTFGGGGIPQFGAPWNADVGGNILITDQSTFTHLTQAATDHWTMRAGNNFTMTNASVFTQSPLAGSADVNWEFFAGRDMFITSTTSLTKNINGQLNLVVDNNFPAFPAIGPGGFTIDATSMITHIGPLGELRIFTATPFQNSIAGLFNLNGGTYLAGPLLVNTAQETWCAYYFRPEFVQLFMLFYKICDLGPVFRDSSAPIVTVEGLRNLHPYDEYLGWPLYFDMKDRKKAFTIPYFIREPKRLKSNPKTPEVETFNDSEVISVAL